jgi:predicted PurR-regulated permease PerM
MIDSQENAYKHKTFLNIPKKVYRNMFLVIVFAVLTIQLVDWVFLSLKNFLLILLFAWLIAISIDPIVTFLANKGIRRGMSTGLVLFSLFALVGGFIFLMGQALVMQISELVEEFPAIADNIVNWVEKNSGGIFVAESLRDSFTSFSFDGGATSLAGGVLGIFTGVIGVIFSFVAVFVFAFYFSAARPQWEGWIASWLKPTHQKIFIEVADISILKAGGFVISKVLLAFISSVAHVLFFWAIDIPFWLPMGIFAGITSQFIPIVGTYLGVIVPAFFVISTDPIDVVWIIVFATIYQQIENYILTPKISSRTMNVNSGIALGAVFVGVALIGPIGALVGIPLVAIVFSVLDTYGKRYDLHPDVADRVGDGSENDVTDSDITIEEQS